MAPNEPETAPPPMRPSPISPPIVPHGLAQYEFSPSDNLIIENLGSKLSFVGLFMLGIGLSCFLSVIVRWIRFTDLDVFLLFIALLLIPVGIWTHRAGREFRVVATSEGKDISHLMEALANLLRLCTLVSLILFISLVFAIIQFGAYCL